MDELDQGSVLYGLRSDRYPGIPCYGIVITASCDIANSKVSKIVRNVVHKTLLTARAKSTM